MGGMSDLYLMMSDVFKIKDPLKVARVFAAIGTPTDRIFEKMPKSMQRRNI